jgi:dolichyl-phosphate-mannose--protein O-mannosyl transferase/Gpi18-like mannosyltransferase
LRQITGRRGQRAGWKALAASFAAAAALAAATAPQAYSGKLLGLFTGLAIFAVVAYEVFRLCAPLARERDEGFASALVMLVLLLAIKGALLLVFPGFRVDIGTYQAWALSLVKDGPAHVYRAGYFLDYPPGYLYVLWAAGLLARALHATGAGFRVIVESPALIADFVLATVVFAWVRRSPRPTMALPAMLMVALNPAMLFDSVVWGQTDSVFTLVMWLTIVALSAEEYEAGFALAAVSVLVKPQGLMLLPVVGLWTLFKTGWPRWWRAGLAFSAVFVIGILPFQLGHRWDWIVRLYGAGAAYYHETSVNAFNLMALLGGIRQPDSATVLGVSFFALGMGLLVPLFGFIAWVLWRRRTASGLFYASFLALFGFFMLAPRMHERYLYPALVFVIPLALESPQMLVVFAILTLTCLFNLAYVLHALDTVVFLEARDPLALACAGLNLALFALAVRYGVAGLGPEAAENSPLADLLDRLRTPATLPAGAANESGVLVAPPWIRLDTIVLGALLAGAAATRFWHLGRPPEIVFDEVHFVNQARHYLHGEPFLDPHPPLAKLLIAAGIWLFGDHPWSWRVGNATLGTVMVGVTYLFGRRILGSRLGATLAAGFILCDGMFLVDSRVAVIDIVYLTFAAISYLLLFRFIQTDGLLEKRKVLPWIGVALGLCLGSKLYVPAFTCVFVAGFIAYDLWRMPERAHPGRSAASATGSIRERRIIAGVTMVAAVTTFFYLLTFLPHYLEGWWGGIGDLFHYYKRVIWYENAVANATHPYASPWWSWPLMLRPVAYWQDFPKVGKVATIWGGGNPLLWWGALTAITIVAVRAIERPRIDRSFLVLGYLGYLLIWVWIGRTLFLYHYMGSVYLGYLALGGVLADCWQGTAEFWEHFALVFTIAPAAILGLGWGWGGLAFAVLMAVYAALLPRPEYVGKFVCAVFVACGLILFFYFYPVWTALPIERSGYYARMWLQGPGLRNWI